MTSQTVSDLSYADKLWQAADKLRGQVDAAEKVEGDGSRRRPCSCKTWLLLRL